MVLRRGLSLLRPTLRPLLRIDARLKEVTDEDGPLGKHALQSSWLSPSKSSLVQLVSDMQTCWECSLMHKDSQVPHCALALQV